MWLSKIADLLAQWTKRKTEYPSSDGNCAFWQKIELIFCRSSVLIHSRWENYRKRKRKLGDKGTWNKRAGYRNSELKVFCETASFRVTVLCFMNYLKGEQRIRKSKQQPQNCCKEVKFWKLIIFIVDVSIFIEDQLRGFSI